MLQWEHSAILSAFINLSLISLFCLFLSGHFTQVLLYFNLFLASTLRDETAEMLIQQGLEEIAQAPTSEQIAFLLVERARLLDELEAEQIRSQSAVSDGRLSEELQRTIDREREELHEEMEQQRTLSRNEADQLKREHEEEINVVMEENTRLEEELNEMKNKVIFHLSFDSVGELSCSGVSLSENKPNIR